VFGTSAARHWATLLAAIEQPGHQGRTAGLGLTPFIGWDATRLACADDSERDRLADRVRQWSAVLVEHGVAALLETVTAEGLAERLMRTTTGERQLTDLRHVGQALHVASVQEGLGVAALSDWLRRRIDEAADDYAEERSRRLETDAAAVQVVTVHASKGLEFPVVYVPFAWDRYESKSPPLLRYHDDDGTRVLHVGGPDDDGYPAARHQLCGAHLVRELTAAAESDPTQRWPVQRITKPANTTAADTAASAAMCWNAARTLMSCSRPRTNSKAVAPLTAMATAATQIIVCASAGAGLKSRLTASEAMAPTAINRNRALISAERIDAFLSP